ncbi:hypothetical protein HMPREF0103_1662 [Bacteroides sp. 2_1_33B]|uniref:Major fimbrial subunit protein N-terminal domain-containing protein n=1 Tax=Parabacteroides distasonis TaxID=823 RepID=A0A1Y4ITK7_PARDI|nr:fimbrial protein [Parabacteroides distasonis]EEY83421.1 hypothetical protein HMPREF0103_1662 [Bacteroides sp. 2_1_33B]OUP22806.1 hypothetical protein B5F32_01025 [Parabacteroides distasonis]
MKLRHLLLASFAACAFASCSDDSSNGIEIPEENYQMIDANVSLTATALDGIQTKAADAGENGSDKEQFINELTAYLFYVDNGEEDAYKFAAMKTVTSDGTNSVKTIEDIVVKVKATAAGELSDTQLKVIFLANTKLATPPATLGDVKNAQLESLVDFTHVHPALGVTQTYVPMFSQIVTIGGGTENGKKLLAGTEYDNWVTAVASPTVVYTKNTEIGKEHKKVTSSGGSAWTEGEGTYNPNGTPDADKIPLTRHVARVQLQAIDCDFKNNYANASFELKDVYIANASNTSLIYADAEPYSLDNAKAYSHGCSYNRDDYFLVNGSKNVASLHCEMDEGVLIAMTGHSHSSNLNADGSINYNAGNWFPFDDQTISGDEQGRKEMPQFYVFEMKGDKPMPSDPGKSDSPSGMIQTMLILRGNWYPNGKTEGLGNDVVKKDRYYRIPIKQDATSGIIGVQRNTIYKIYATITGEGSKDPDTSELNACISFSIKVEPWKVITQTEDDVN